MLTIEDKVDAVRPLRSSPQGGRIDIDAANAALGQMPRGDRLLAITILAADLDALDLRALFAGWWSDTEFPSNHGTGRIVELFRSAGFVTDAEDTMSPTVPMTVYRGVSAGGRPRGVS